MQKLKTFYPPGVSGYVCVLVTFLLTVEKSRKEVTQGRNNLSLLTTSMDIIHHGRASVAAQVVQHLVAELADCPVHILANQEEESLGQNQK